MGIQFGRGQPRVRTKNSEEVLGERLMDSGDRDVSDFHGELRDFRHAATASFNALRQDFVGLRTHVDNGFTEMRGWFDGMALGQQQIVDLLQTVIIDQGHNGPAE